MYVTGRKYVSTAELLAALRKSLRPAGLGADVKRRKSGVFRPLWTDGRIVAE